MLFSVVTPSFRNSNWLRLCVASVADQQGVEHEHIVQDACSDDGTQEWLPHDTRVQAFIEKDNGMYDAVNRGWRRSTGEIVSYLNCDEQYLPGTLQAVQNFFITHPKVDVLLPDTLVVDAQGRYLCHRPSLMPRWPGVWVRFNMNTSSLFIRRRVLDEMELYFDPRWRCMGDHFWLIEAARCGVVFATQRWFASVFTETGANLALGSVASNERAERRRMMPWWIKALSPFYLLQHRLRMLATGAHRQPAFDYSIYTLASLDRRVSFRAAAPTTKWIRPAQNSAFQNNPAQTPSKT
jgi:glycosyltransferase involved in cell wall biosynthesis